MFNLPPVIFAPVQLFFYNIFLLLYRSSIQIAALFNNEKAKKWVDGRRDILQKIKTTLPHHEKRIWIHCASVGEFEQARPLIEKLKMQNAKCKIVLTFFSPSGYELHKSYEHADYVFYLPMDGRKRAAKFIRAVNPLMAIFIKYEFWYYYICNLERNNIPLVLVSGAFREEQHFFRWYGGLFRKMLYKFSFFFLQDEYSKKLLSRIGIEKNVTVTGDTRYDRVFEIAKQAKSFPLIEQWKGNAKLLIAGSTWEADENILKESITALPSDWKIIIAPHEIDTKHLTEIKKLFGKEAIFYSQLLDKKATSSECSARLLIIDNIGMLSSVFRYGDIAFIGGGFSKGGIHNTLEPAVFGLPIIFGPVYEKFVEAKELVKRGFAFPVNNAAGCKDIINRLSNSPEVLAQKKNEMKGFIQENVGATDKIFQGLPIKLGMCRH